MFGLPNTIILAVVAAVSAGGGVFVAREYYTGKIAKIELSYAAAKITAVEEARKKQAAADDITLAAALSVAAVNEKIITRTLTITKEVPKYVKDDSGCITYGFIRLHDAAAIGADPADLPLPAGKFNETCAPITPTAMAEAIVANYGAAWQNSGQLTQLQRWVSETAKAIGPAP